MRRGSIKRGGKYINMAFALVSLPISMLIVNGERIINVGKTTPSIMEALIRRGSCKKHFGRIHHLLL